MASVSQCKRSIQEAQHRIADQALGDSVSFAKAYMGLPGWHASRCFPNRTGWQRLEGISSHSTIVHNFHHLFSIEPWAFMLDTMQRAVARSAGRAVLDSKAPQTPKQSPGRYAGTQAIGPTYRNQSETSQSGTKVATDYCIRMTLRRLAGTSQQVQARRT